jgi:hypothetical protein
MRFSRCNYDFVVLYRSLTLKEEQTEGVLKNSDEDVWT